MMFSFNSLLTAERLADVDWYGTLSDIMRKQSITDKEKNSSLLLDAIIKIKANTQRPFNLNTFRIANIIDSEPEIKYVIKTTYTPWAAKDVVCRFIVDDEDPDTPKLLIAVGWELGKDAWEDSRKYAYRRRTSKPVNDEQVLISDIPYKPFKFVIPLHNINVKPEDVQVSSKDGLITIEISFKDKANVKKHIDVPIKVNLEHNAVPVEKS